MNSTQCNENCYRDLESQRVKSPQQLITAKTIYWMTPNIYGLDFYLRCHLTSYWFRNYFKNRFVPSQPHTSYFKRCFKYNKAWVWNCKSHDLCSAVSFKAQVCWSNFGSFCQKSVISSVRQVPMVFFSLPYFAKPYQSSKVYIIPPWGTTNLCQLWNLTDFSNYDLKENVI